MSISEIDSIKRDIDDVMKNMHSISSQIGENLKREFKDKAEDVYRDMFDQETERYFRDKFVKLVEKQIVGRIIDEKLSRIEKELMQPMEKRCEELKRKLEDLDRQIADLMKMVQK